MNRISAVILGALVCMLVALPLIRMRQDVQAPLQAASSDSLERPGASEQPAQWQPTPEPVRAAVEAVPPPADAKESPQPQTQLVKFSDLQPSVQDFIAQAAQRTYRMKRKELDTYSFDPRSIVDYSLQVAQLVARYEEAQLIYDEEVEKLKAQALRDGKFQSCPDEKSFNELVASYEKAESKPFVISINGEEEGPLGEPRPYFKVVAVNLTGYPALKQAKEFVDGFEEWREAMRAKALPLIATAHSARTGR